MRRARGGSHADDRDVKTRGGPSGDSRLEQPGPARKDYSALAWTVLKKTD
jgi:hypothetical protein